MIDERKSSSKANQIVVYLHRKASSTSEPPHKRFLPSQSRRDVVFIFAKFESIIHKNGQKAWGTSASSDNFSAYPLLSRDEHVTNDSAERDGSSWRMCMLICFLRSLFLDKFFCESSRFISSQRRMCFCHPHTKQRTKGKQAWWNLLRSLSILKTFHSRKKKIDNESRFRRRGDPRK